MPILEYTRSILLQCVLQSPHPVVVKVHLQFFAEEMELSAIHLLLIKLDTNDGANYDINRNTAETRVLKNQADTIFSITLIKHRKVMSNFSLFLPFLYTSYRKSYILALVTECLKYQPGFLLYHQVISKAILCCLSFPFSIGNPTLPLPQVSTVAVLLLVTLKRNSQPFCIQNPTVAQTHSYIQSQFFKQDGHSFALSKCPCYHNPHNSSLVQKDYSIPSS